MKFWNVTKRIAQVTLGMATCLAGAGAALAIVTFDPTCQLSVPGVCGFVGKGDVQSPWGWNNATMQVQAQNVAFSYAVSATYDVTIEFDTGSHTVQHHTVTQTKSTDVSATIASDPRKTGQWTGWYLTGLGDVTTSGDNIPSVGDSCPNGDNCVVTAVTLVSTTGGLFASDNSVSPAKGPTQIWP